MPRCRGSAGSRVGHLAHAERETVSFGDDCACYLADTEMAAVRTEHPIERLVVVGGFVADTTWLPSGYALPPSGASRNERGNWRLQRTRAAAEAEGLQGGSRASRRRRRRRSRSVSSPRNARPNPRACTRRPTPSPCAPRPKPRRRPGPFLNPFGPYFGALAGNEPARNHRPRSAESRPPTSCAR